MLKKYVTRERSTHEIGHMLRKNLKENPFDEAVFFRKAQLPI